MSGGDPEKNPRDDEGHISDQEWELRTGRAIDILQQTLPGFFTTGLVNTNFHLPLSGIHGLLDRNGKGKGRADEGLDEDFGIYSRNIRLEYTPPTALPAPFPRVLTLEGLSLYVASSAFVRHSMNALYTDLHVVARKVNVMDHSTLAQGKRRKAFTIGLLVSGMGRLGLGTSREAEWDVTATYEFSPASGLISKHIVNSIDPAPHETVFAALRSSLVKLGLVGQETAGREDAIPGKLDGAINSRLVSGLQLEPISTSNISNDSERRESGNTPNQS
ncbi:hypothetical protein SCHPADRAFT_818998 [Schizopora paradoxa]|uniref:Uncharacterized protein n=1 Tax=Schizopora paradoxa TaxID=27342 RepID=A0A0H2S3U0_9AGAM|nr:hypothetical protein SCHPADRAFT_818998 [Schizopora paradoxa]